MIFHPCRSAPWSWVPGAIGLALGSGCTHMTVQPGQVAVVSTPNGPAEKVYPEGDYQLGFYDQPTFYDARSQERDEAVTVLASNGVQVGMDLAVRYHIVLSETVQLNREIGMHYYSVLVGPTVKSQARRAAAEMSPEELRSTGRERLERRIREGAGQAMQGRHVVIEAVLIRNVTLPAAIQSALDAKLAAAQEAARRRLQLEATQRQFDEVRSKHQALDDSGPPADPAALPEDGREGMQQQIDDLKRQLEEVKARQRELEDTRGQEDAPLP